MSLKMAFPFCSLSVRLVLLAAALLTAGAVLSLPAESAWAHNSLRASQPAQGEALARPPAQVVLTFDDDVLDVGSAVQVTGPAGPVGLGALRVAGAVVTQPLPPDLPAGEYRVVWRVTSADGHPVDGTLTFTAATGTTPASPSPSGPATSGVEQSATEGEQAGPPPAGSGERSEGDASVEDEAGDGISPLVWGLGAVAVVLVAGASWYGATRMRSR